MNFVTSQMVEDTATWLEDLYWHRQMFKPARTQWDGREVIDVVTRHTNGQLEFSTLADLESLSVTKGELDAAVQLVEKSLGVAAQRAAIAFCGDWSAVGEQVGLDWRDLRRMAEVAARTPAFVSHPDVRVAVQEVPSRNPLSEAWEIKQLRSLWVAAAQMVEDAACDLIEELVDAGLGWDSLLVSVWDGDAHALRARVRRNRDARGAPGDPRRRARQRF